MLVAYWEKLLTITAILLCRLISGDELVMGKIAAFITVFLALSVSYASADNAAGIAVFKEGKCKNCHHITAKKKVGPGLAGISKRAPEEWIKSWLVDYKAVWTANEGYTKTLKKVMKKESKPKPTHKVKIKLSDQQVSDLIEYLNTL